MLKGLTADLTGSSDICSVVQDLAGALASAYLLPGETLLFSLQSTKEEFSFTNEALIRIIGESSTTTRRLVTRLDYKSHIVANVRFETAGRVDRDCELKFQIGSENISIDVAKNQEAPLRDFYKVLELLSRAQKANERTWEFSRIALDKSADTMRLHEASLVNQAGDTLAWIQQIYDRTHPRCYREVIQSAFNSVRLGHKME